MLRVFNLRYIASSMFWCLQRAPAAIADVFLRSDKALKQALEDQNVLTQEVSHRVKNSLAIVASLLRLQKRRSIDPDVQRVLMDAEARVRAIAQLHDRLLAL